MEGGNKDREEGEKERGERYKIEDTHTRGGWDYDTNLFRI